MTEHWQQKRPDAKGCHCQAEQVGQDNDGHRTSGVDENVEKYKQFDDRDGRYEDDEPRQDERDGSDENDKHGQQGRPNLVISVLSDKEPLSMNQRSLKSIVYDLVNAADEAKGKHHRHCRVFIKTRDNTHMLQ